MTGQASSWEGLPNAKTLQALASFVPDGPSRILSDLETEAAHIRKMSIWYLRCAMAVVVMSMALTIILAVMNRQLPATGAAVGGGASVVGILIGGRPSGIKITDKLPKP
jgi:uncharacterized BrkB/YihY/UPF0761 family membrane protein